MIAEQSDAEKGEIEEDNEIDNDGLFGRKRKNLRLRIMSNQMLFMSAWNKN